LIFLSKWSSQTLCAGAELGLFDWLSRDSTRTASEAAADTGLDPTLLYRLLRALASIGLLNESPGRQFNLTERGALLRTDAPGSLRCMAMLEADRSIGRSGNMCLPWSGTVARTRSCVNTAKWRSTTRGPIPTLSSVLLSAMREALT
jgi:hypothetical protein